MTAELMSIHPWLRAHINAFSITKTKRKGKKNIIQRVL